MMRIRGASLMAFGLQNSWQQKHEMHRAASITGYGSIRIASTGHCRAHAPHLMQMSVSACGCVT